ncbi:MAG TPA: hypothetical protein V6C58_11000, partial [Allocoleopsis sp.]
NVQSFDNNDDFFNALDESAKHYEQIRIESREIIKRFKEPVKSILMNLIKLSDEMSAELIKLDSLDIYDDNLEKEIVNKYKSTIIQNGELINQIGGFELMQFSCDCLHLNMKRFVEVWWDGIGDWQS